MEKYRLSDFKGGWVAGNFEPSLTSTGSALEFGVKYFMAGDYEECHFQFTATEISIVVSGKCRIGGLILESGDVLKIGPGEKADFVALTDCVLAVCKTPSLPSDKGMC